MAKDRYGYGIAMNEDSKINKHDRERYDSFKRRLQIGRDLRLPPMLVPNISEKELNEWKNFQIYPQNLINSIENHSKTSGMSTDSYLNPENDFFNSEKWDEIGRNFKYIGEEVLND
jgi:hypothetical protein